MLHIPIVQYSRIKWYCFFFFPIAQVPMQFQINGAGRGKMIRELKATKIICSKIVQRDRDETVTAAMAQHIAAKFERVKSSVDLMSGKYKPNSYSMKS